MGKLFASWRSHEKLEGNHLVFKKGSARTLVTLCMHYTVTGCLARAKSWVICSSFNDFIYYLILEGAQAGLSWITVLKKRDNYRLSFDYFDAEKIADYDAAKCQKLLTNSGIIRNRLKIQSVITNAQVYLAVKQIFTSFSEYIWQFVDGKSICNQ